MKSFYVLALTASLISLSVAPSVAQASSPSTEKQEQDAKANYELAVNYREGKKDLKKAFDLCKGAAEKGVVEAQSLLALMYEKGEGTAEDLGQALHWCEEAVKNGYEQAKEKAEALRAKIKEKI